MGKGGKGATRFGGGAYSRVDMIEDLRVVVGLHDSGGRHFRFVTMWVECFGVVRFPVILGQFREVQSEWTHNPRHVELPWFNFPNKTRPDLISVDSRGRID
jgi:hypothetical protein